MGKGYPCPNRHLCPGWTDGIPPMMKVTREIEQKMGYLVFYWCPHCDMTVKDFEDKPEWLIKMQEGQEREQE